MAINRVDKFDYIKLAYANSLSDIKSKIDEIQEKECIIAVSEKKLVVKIEGKLFSIDFVEVS